MRVVHTSDWHVGKLLRGASRIDEHRTVLGEIAEIADRERADLVLVVEFPFPAWATRPDERGENPAESGELRIPDDLLEGVPPGPRG